MPLGSPDTKKKATCTSSPSVPLSALDGDNVVERSTQTPWYDGHTLLEHLEQVPVWAGSSAQRFRIPVQRVIWPSQHYRGFAGQIASGTLRAGDTVVALPSGRSSKVTRITTFDGDPKDSSALQTKTISSIER